MILAWNYGIASLALVEGCVGKK